MLGTYREEMFRPGQGVEGTTFEDIPDPSR